jgi:thiol-disulfide isomerase/thioredoxin/uncharacterized membrane protein YphA (DoxX/SURF4 family)
MISDLVSVLARPLLAVVFLLAGIAKLADRGGSRKALTDFGVPVRLASPLGIVLPIVELTVAVILIPSRSAWLGAAGALSLLLAFTIVISINLARGRKPDCHCFGQLHSAPAGWSTLARNAVMACVAGFLVWEGQRNPAPSLVSWLSGLTVPERVTLLGGLLVVAFLAGQAALLLQILRQQGRMLLRLDAFEARLGATGTAVQSPTTFPGLPMGSPAPGFRLSGLDGKTVSLEGLVAESKPVLLLFTNPNCGPCQSLLPEVGRWQREHGAKLTIALVSEGKAAENRAKTAAHGPILVLLQQKREVAEIYQAWATPTAVLVWPDGMIGSPAVQGAEAIRAMVSQILSEARTPRTASAAAHRGNGDGHHLPSLAAPKPGAPSPAVELQDLDGKSVNLNAFRGRETVLLFWNPGCGFCQRMLGDVRKWDADLRDDAPRLVVISTGKVADGRAMGLRSSVLIDPQGQAATAFGAHGTPMAVLLDADGRIASEIAAGAQAVLALANVKPATMQR